MLSQQIPHGRALIEAVFKQQRSAAAKMRWGVRGNFPYRIESVDAGNQRLLRFETQIALSEMFIADRDVRRVAHDCIENAIADVRQPIAFPKVDIPDLQPLRVGARDIERGQAEIDGYDTSVWTFVSDGQRDRTRTGA